MNRALRDRKSADQVKKIMQEIREQMQREREEAEALLGASAASEQTTAESNTTATNVHPTANVATNGANDPTVTTDDTQEELPPVPSGILNDPEPSAGVVVEEFDPRTITAALDEDERNMLDSDL